MPTNRYFNNFNSEAEQKLIESLVVESIKVYGHDMYWCPRRISYKDEILGYDPIPVFDSAYLIDFFIKSFEGYEGEGVFMSQFQLEIRDQVTVCVAIKTFNDIVGPHEDDIVRPLEGDLLFIPMLDRAFQIKYVKKTSVFYQLGSLQFYDIVAELFEYTGEKLRTGVAIIDAIETINSTDMSRHAITDENDIPLSDETGFPIIDTDFNYEDQIGDNFTDNKELSEEASKIINFSQIDPISQGYIGEITVDQRGNIGFTGFRGSRGLRGIIGYSGSVGRGYTGFTGSVGSIGVTGYQGSVGYTGSSFIGGANAAVSLGIPYILLFNP